MSLKFSILSRYRTRTDEENSSLCRSFSDYFVSKINDLKSFITAKLSAIPTPQFFSDLPHFDPLFRNISPVSAAEFHRILTSCPVEASSADCIPPSIIKAYNLFLWTHSRTDQSFFPLRYFPSCLKHASVVPLLKKPSVDKHAPYSYRPISNLDFITKILERLFLARIQCLITSSRSFNQYQSAYAATIPPKHPFFTL